MQEGFPSLAHAPAPSAIPADRRIREVDAEVGQFGLNAFAAPGGITGPQVAEEANPLSVKSGSATTGTRFPAPKEPKAQAMPGDHGLGLEDEKHSFPTRPALLQEDPEPAISVPKQRFRNGVPEHCQLMARCPLFQHELRAGLKPWTQQAQDCVNQSQHPPRACPRPRKSQSDRAAARSSLPTRYSFLSRSSWSIEPVM